MKNIIKQFKYVRKYFVGYSLSFFPLYIPLSPFIPPALPLTLMRQFFFLSVFFTTYSFKCFFIPSVHKLQKFTSANKFSIFTRLNYFSHV